MTNAAPFADLEHKQPAIAAREGRRSGESGTDSTIRLAGMLELNAAAVEPGWPMENAEDENLTRRRTTADFWRACARRLRFLESEVQRLSVGK